MYELFTYLTTTATTTLGTGSSTADAVGGIVARGYDKRIGLMRSVVALNRTVSSRVGYVNRRAANLPSFCLVIDRMAGDYSSAIFHALLKGIGVPPRKNSGPMPFSAIHFEGFSVRSRVGHTVSCGTGCRAELVGEALLVYRWWFDSIAR